MQSLPHRDMKWGLSVGLAYLLGFRALFAWVSCASVVSWGAFKHDVSLDVSKGIRSSKNRGKRVLLVQMLSEAQQGPLFWRFSRGFRFSQVPDPRD